MQSICLDEVGGEKAFDTPTKETTLIHHIFGGYLQSQVQIVYVALCKVLHNFPWELYYEGITDLFT